MELAYRCYALHANKKCIRAKVPRIREGIFFPQFGEQVTFTPNRHMVYHEIAFEKEMDGRG